jgi:hypothetical protein
MTVASSSHRVTVLVLLAMLSLVLAGCAASPPGGDPPGGKPAARARAKPAAKRRAKPAARAKAPPMGKPAPKPTAPRAATRPLPAPGALVTGEPVTPRRIALITM